MNAGTSAFRGHGGEAPPWLTGLGLALAAGLWFLLGPAPEALVFDRAAIAAGEGWRLVSGHLVHCDPRHALLDIAALAVVGYLMESQGRLRMLLAAVTGMLTVDLCLWWALPELERYCGLSGMLHAMFVVALADLWQRHRHPVYAAAALVLLVKLAAESRLGGSLLLDSPWPSVPLTHLAGAVAGLAFIAAGRKSGKDRALSLAAVE